ncbi:phosphatidylinositol-3,5-bisphosphate 5-phosphatase [Maublancomyces gigas]|uniref:Phosphatidylinositol-3,5-bisphosphate 5-phosphatase n=1 Tax=Discina gigas TaxID=1032678 RepID=A0ABR3G8Z2_9PEZI
MENEYDVTSPAGGAYEQPCEASCGSSTYSITIEDPPTTPPSRSSISDEEQSSQVGDDNLSASPITTASDEIPGPSPPPPVRVETPEPPQPTYPQLSNTLPASPVSKHTSKINDKDESIPKSFDRSDKKLGRIEKEVYEDKDFDGVRRMHKFTLYETATRFYIVGSDLLDSRFRILKIDRTAEVGDLSITEDEVIYTREETSRLLATIEDGNKSTGGLKHRCPFWGLLGFVRFTGAYYMLLITKRSNVAMIGGHYVYQVRLLKSEWFL